MNENNDNTNPHTTTSLELSPERKAEVRAEYDGGVKLIGGMFLLVGIVPMCFVIHPDFILLGPLLLSALFLLAWAYSEFSNGQKWSYSTSRYYVEDTDLIVGPKDGSDKRFNAAELKKINSVGKTLKFKSGNVPIEGMLSDRNPDFMT